MSPIRTGSRRRRLAVALGAVGALSVLVGGVALATLLTTFDTEDGNLKHDGLPAAEIDWADVNEIRKDDLPTGSGDDSFTQGTKEDTTSPVTEFGSIPPNKSDLKTFGVYVEGKVVHLYWTRVQDPSGTTNMDFEFNQSSTLAPNGITPVRTAGDLLVTYELAKGGTVPRLFLLQWLTAGPTACDSTNAYPCWGGRVDLTAAGNASGSINQVDIPSGEADNLGALSARTFGEASINLQPFFDPSKCTSFGSAYLKSRSSDSFTSALKDFIAPVPTNISNCAKVIIRKETNPEEDPNTTDFGFTKAFTTDPSTTNTFTLQDDGSKAFNSVVLGNNYTVEETTVPSGWELQGVDCSASTGVTPTIASGKVTFAIDATTDILDCTYTNRAFGNLKLVKNTTGGNDTFPFTHSIAGLDNSLTTVGGTADDTSDAIAAGTSYAVAEGTLPTGWDFTSASCKLGDGTTSTGTVSGKGITGITVQAGKTTTCTFANTKRGAITLVKNTTGGDATFPFTHSIAGLDSSLTTVGGTKSDTSDAIAPGTSYAIAEGTLPDGWDFTSASCKLQDGTTSTGSVSGKSITAITVEAGKTTTCTFANTASGYITLVKNTTGGNATFPFTHSITGLDNSLTTIGGTASDTSDKILPGTSYAIAEGTLPAGWDFTSASCALQGGSATGSVSGKSITAITVEAGKTTTCTFSNTKRGAITLVKNTTGGNATFPFTHTITGLDNSLTTAGGTASDTSDPIVPGSSYAIAEGTLPAGWDFTSASCALQGGGTTGSVSGKSITAITVEAGKTTTCTFSNTAFGYITLVKNTTGGNDTFPFTHSIGGLSASLTTVGGTASDTSDKLLPGSGYAIAEGTLPSGWAFKSASCKLEDGTTATGTVTGKSITGITVEVGKTTTCTFTNAASYRVIVLVCDESTLDLYPSDVTLGPDTKTSIGAGQLPVIPGFSGTPDELMAILCGTGGAQFNGLAPNPDPGYDVKVKIPNPS